MSEETENPALETEGQAAAPAPEGDAGALETGSPDEQGTETSSTPPDSPEVPAAPDAGSLSPDEGEGNPSPAPANEPAGAVSFRVKTQFQQEDEIFELGAIVQVSDLDTEVLERRIAGGFIELVAPPSPEDAAQGFYYCLVEFAYQDEHYMPGDLVDVEKWDDGLIRRRVENGFIQFRP